MRQNMHHVNIVNALSFDDQVLAKIKVITDYPIESREAEKIAIQAVCKWCKDHNFDYINSNWFWV